MQIPENPVGTMVVFHGCHHDASGSWPYDPVNCPECRGLPEELAILKLSLKYGYAVLAVESRNRTMYGDNVRCFTTSGGAGGSNNADYIVPSVIQTFVYSNGLQGMPVYVEGVSAGAAYAVKLPKAFYYSDYGFNISGIISGAWRCAVAVGGQGRA